MITVETMALFFLASVALALAPGPDNLFVLTQSALHGRKAGLLVTVGLCTGLLGHTAAVALGVAVIFKTSIVAFNLLKIAGALYLLFLAWKTFRASANSINGEGRVRLSSRELYLRGVIMNVTNPKVAIFFLAFLPQFASPAVGSITFQMFQLGGLFIIATLLVFGGIAWSAGLIGDWLKRSARAQVVLNRVAGTVFTALAVRLVVSEH